MTVLAADTDGTDGVQALDDPPGLCDGATAERARALGLDPASFLANNNSTHLFASLGPSDVRTDLRECYDFRHPR